MIVTKIQGGLGNQMFQYAAGLALAQRLNTPLYLNTSWFDEIRGVESVVQRVYELEVFGIYPPHLSLFDKAQLKLSPLQHVLEKVGAYNEELESLKGNILLDGYWQNQRYFKEAEQTVRNSFKFAPFSSSEKIKTATAINNTKNTVSINVRRSDYVTHKASRAVLGPLPLSYYRDAVKMMAQRIKNPHFFVISDDSTWCKKNMKLDFPTTFVEHIPNTGSQDMHLVSLCDHHIIANSTFSWWGAWLNNKPDKIVIGPKKWFTSAKYGKNPILDEWIKI